MAYELFTKLAHKKNYGGTRGANRIKYIVIHYTANDGDTAAGNANYFANNIVEASAHYFVDDNFVYNSVPELSVAWAVGGKKWNDTPKTGGGTMYGKINNTNSISIELCDTVKDGVIQATEKTMQNAAALCRQLMQKYNISVWNVYRHFDVTGKHCPAYFMDAAKWAAFKARLTTTEGSADDMTDEEFYKRFCESMSKYMQIGGTGDKPSAALKQDTEWAKQNGLFQGNGAGDYGWALPITRQAVAAVLHRQEEKSGRG